MNIIDLMKDQVQALHARLNILKDLTGVSTYNTEQRAALLKEAADIITDIKALNNKIFVESQILEYLDMVEKSEKAATTLH